MKRTIPDNPESDSIWRPDVTVACVVPRNDTFLLVEENIHQTLVLNQPAGHLEPDETLSDAARRETIEETGWDVSLDALIGVYQWTNLDNKRHFLRFTFAATPVRHYPQRHLDDGIVRALWLSRDEIAADRSRLRSPMVLRCIDDWIAGKRQPLDVLHYLNAHP